MKVMRLKKSTYERFDAFLVMLKKRKMKMKKEKMVEKKKTKEGEKKDVERDRETKECRSG